MFVELSERHHTPHFHAYYGEHVGVFSIEHASLVAGSLPQRQRRLVQAWAELHQDELLAEDQLLADWNLLQERQPAVPIAPLQ